MSGIDRSAVSSDFRVPLRRARAVRLSLPAAGALVAPTVLVAALLAGYYALHATSWAVMTDELQVVRLAESIAQRLSPVPQIHGAYYGALAQLYPLLLAPFFGLFSAPVAATAAHALNAVLLPSAAWPAYLLARSVTGSRRAALAAAALTAFTPWLVLTSTLLTENAAYPAFVWAVYLCHRTLRAPSARNDVLALLGLGLAFSARTQLLVLAAAFPLALLVHELGFAGLREGATAAVARHRVVSAAYAAAVVCAGVLLWLGALSAVVGNYAVPFSGDLVPAGTWSSAAEHLVHVVVGGAVLPFVLGTAWAAVTLVRRGSKPGHAFAALYVVVVPMLCFEVASFDLRFTPNAFDQDRYLFYLAPLFAVALTAALSRPAGVRALVFPAVAIFGVFVWLLFQFGNYDDTTVIFWAAPAAAVHTVFPGNVVLALCAATLVAGALLLLWRVPRLALACVAAVVSILGAAQAVYVFQRYAAPAMSRPPMLPRARDWIDRHVPPGESVALVPSPRDTPTYWWEAELWNKRVDRLLRVNGGPTFSPFPADELRIDFRRGVLVGPQPSDYFVLSGSEKRFRPVELRRVVGTPVLQLVRVERPYRLEWATRGLTPDGWTVSGRPATLRIYGQGEQARRRVVVVLAASSRAALPLDFRLRGGGVERAGWVDPGGARPPVRLGLCIPPRGFVDVKLTTHGSVRIPDGRLVGLHLDRLTVSNVPGCGAGQVSSR